MVIPFIFSKLYAKDKLEQTNVYESNKLIVPITKGICSLDKGRTIISTFDNTQKMYVRLPPSQNAPGGAQFSYSFWLRRGTNTEQELKNKIIFYRGYPEHMQEKAWHYQRGDGDVGVAQDKNMFYSEDQKYDENGVLIPNVKIKCPLIRFGDTPNKMRIEFNSIKHPYLHVDLEADVFGLLKSNSKHPRFNLITFSVQDNFDFGGIERGINFNVFIDDALVKTQAFEDNALRLNEGPIALFPSQRDNTMIDADIANLTYYNYALSTREVNDIYNRGFANKACELPDSWNSDAALLNYGKLNLWNETKQIETQ
jgi:hypothetical protein